MNDSALHFPFRRPLLAPLAVLLLSGLLLLTWFRVLAAAPAPTVSHPQLLPASQGTDRLANPSDLTAMLLPTVTATTPASATQPPTATSTKTASPAPLQEQDAAALQAPFDLRITKNQIPSTSFRVGTGNIYVITVNRTNTETINQLVVVEDALPAGLTWTPINIGKWNCTSTSTTRLVSCFYGETDPDTFDQLQFSVVVPEDVSSFQFQNTAYLRTTDGNPDNNQSTVTTNVDSLDLQIAKSVSPTSIITGTVAYSLVITNTGPVEGNNVIVREEVPVDLEFLNVEPAGTVYTQTTSEIVIALGNMPNDTVRRLTVNFRTRASASGKQISNTASVESQNINDYDLTNNEATAYLVVGGLTIQKSAAPTTVRVGEPITFTFSVANPGVSTQTNVILRDVLHPYLSVRSTPSGGAISGNTYSLGIGDLAPGATRTARLVVAGRTVISYTQTITNAATLSWGPTGSVRTIRSNDVSMSITPGGALHATKTNALTTINPGTSISYTLSVTNTGNSTINSIRITDTMLSNLTAVSIEPGTLGTGSCIDSFRCVLTLNNPLTAGQKITFRVGARVPRTAVAGTSIINEIFATGTDDLGQSLSYRSSDTDTVLAAQAFNMAIGKNVAPRQARVGESFTFRINIANNGSVTANNVRVFDEFEDVLDLTSVTTTMGTGTLNTGARTVDVNIGNMAPGTEARITIIARVNSTATAIASYTNQATMTWTGGDQESNNIRFRVLPSATLPGTGWAPRAVAAGLSVQTAMASPLARLLIGVVLLGGMGLAFLGILLLGYSLYVRARHPLRAGSYTRGGLALIVLGLFAGLTGIVMIGLLPGAPQQVELGMLAGEKPPIATQKLSAARPTRTPRPTAEASYEMYLPTPTPENKSNHPHPGILAGLPRSDPNHCHHGRAKRDRAGRQRDHPYRHPQHGPGHRG